MVNFSPSTVRVSSSVLCARSRRSICDDHFDSAWLVKWAPTRHDSAFSESGQDVRIVLDFFISYTHSDQPWAEWIAGVLEDGGYTTRVQARDFTPGRDFVQEMQRAASTAERTIAVLSPAYFDSRFTGSEWTAAFVKDPTGEQGLLIPVRVAELDPPGLLASRIYIDLVGRNEAAARQKLLDGVNARGARPTRPAPYPGGSTAAAAATAPPRFPGALPAVWNVPFRRNLHFTGRATQLAAIGEHFAARGAVPLVVVGFGGVGKTQL